MKNEMVFCGIDVGTQGARCLLVTESGRVMGEGSCPFRIPSVPGLPQGWFEQEPADWMDSVRGAVRAALAGMEKAGQDASAVRALSVTSTSGTLCAVTPDGQPVCNAIMYNDSRSRAEAEVVQAAGEAVATSLGYRFNASFALPKILWLRKNSPGQFEQARWFISPTDFIIGWLTDEWGWTDQTNALKCGYDLQYEAWPGFIGRDLRLPVDRLPRVQMCGEKVGELLADRAEELGLPPETPVAAGLTDGCASQVSSGAVEPGEFNTTIGTTLVVKGVTEKLLLDPQGRVYCHMHPDGYWLPGGASNTGGECLTAEFKPAEVEQFDAAALKHSPTGLVAYPLVARGERFPFVSPKAERFMLGQPACRAELFTAYLEGVACLERMSMEVLEGLGAQVGSVIYSAGGGAKSDAWLQIRADTLNRTMLRPAVTGAAMGAAIVAAMMSGLGRLAEATRRMVKLERQVAPRPDKTAAYARKYEAFRAECGRRGYV